MCIFKIFYYRREVSIQQSSVYLTLHSSDGNLSTRLPQNVLPGRSLVSEVKYNLGLSSTFYEYIRLFLFRRK